MGPPEDRNSSVGPVNVLRELEARPRRRRISSDSTPPHGSLRSVLAPKGECRQRALASRAMTLDTGVEVSRDEALTDIGGSIREATVDERGGSRSGCG